MSEDQPIIKIDLDGFKGDIRDYIKDEFKSLEERLTPKKETTALTEALGSDRIEEKWDWKAPINDLLKSFRGSVSEMDYKLRERKTDVEDVVIREYDKKTREHKYKLKLNESLQEAIGTIAQGAANCCIPEVWADKIELDHVYPGSVFLGAWFLNWYDDIQGKPGDKVYVCRVAPALCVDLTCDEPTTTAPTIACPYITLEHDVCAYAICKNDMECVQYGLVDALNEA